MVIRALKYSRTVRDLSIASVVKLKLGSLLLPLLGRFDDPEMAPTVAIAHSIRVGPCRLQPLMTKNQESYA